MVSRLMRALTIPLAVLASACGGDESSEPFDDAVLMTVGSIDGQCPETGYPIGTTTRIDGEENTSIAYGRSINSTAIEVGSHRITITEDCYGREFFAGTFDFTLETRAIALAHGGGGDLGTPSLSYTDLTGRFAGTNEEVLVVNVGASAIDATAGGSTRSILVGDVGVFAVDPTTNADVSVTVMDTSETLTGVAEPAVVSDLEVVHAARTCTYHEDSEGVSELYCWTGWIAN